MTDVTPFIDLPGASGALYRFRKIEGLLPPIGGNFVYIREKDGVAQVLGCGKSRALGRTLATDMAANGQEGDLYVRLNVAGAKRESEHQDLIAALPEPFTIYETE